MNAGLQIQLGRPYGGVAILWDKRLNNYIQTVDTGSKRIAAILYTRNVYTLLFITAYMSCDTGTCDITKVDEFSEVLNDISLLIQKVNPSDVVIGGDLNTEFNRRSAHPMSLQSFCDNEKLYNAKDHSIADVDYTYCNYATGVTSIIDHFLLTECTFRSILGVKVSHRGANLSDHHPVLIELRIPHQKLKLKNPSRFTGRSNGIMLLKWIIMIVVKK